MPEALYLKRSATGSKRMAERDDATLLKTVAAQRDSAAFAELYERLGQPAYGLALRITHNPDLAEEAVQEAMLYVWRKAAAFRGDGSVRAWALRIVANASLKLMRTQKRSKSHAELSEMTPPLLGAEDLAEKFEQRELTTAMTSALGQLPELEQQILALYYGGNLTQQEIAAVTDVPQQRISQHIQKATDFLRSRLAHAGFAASSAVLARNVIEQAICSGPAAPPGLRMKVLERVASNVSSSLRMHSRRTGLKSSSKALITLGTVAVAATAAGGVWWTLQQPAAPVASAAPVKAITPESTRQPFSYVCDLNSPELPKELTVVKGSWHFVPNGGPDGKGCMETDTELFCVEFNFPVALRPMKGTYFTRILPPVPPDEYICDLGWWPYDRAGTFAHVGVPVRVGPDDWLKIENYVSAHFVDFWTKGERTHINYFEALKPDARMRIYVRGRQQLCKIVIKSIDPAQLPDVSQFQHAIDSLEPSQRKGQVAFPELESKRPPEPVTIRFSDDFQETP